MTETTDAALFVILLVAISWAGRAAWQRWRRHIRDWKGLPGQVQERLREMGETRGER